MFTGKQKAGGCRIIKKMLTLQANITSIIRSHLNMLSDLGLCKIRYFIRIRKNATVPKNQIFFSITSV